MIIIVFWGMLLIWSCLFLFVVLKFVFVNILFSISDSICFCIDVLLVLVLFKVRSWFINVFIWLVFCFICVKVLGFMFCWCVSFNVICKWVSGECSLWEILVNRCFWVFYMDFSCFVILLKFCESCFSLFWCLVVWFICVC